MHIHTEAKILDQRYTRIFIHKQRYQMHLNELPILVLSIQAADSFASLHKKTILTTAHVNVQKVLYLHILYLV